MNQTNHASASSPAHPAGNIASRRTSDAQSPDSRRIDPRRETPGQPHAVPDTAGRGEAARPRGKPPTARLLLEAASEFCMLARPDSRDVSVFREFFTQLIGACSAADRRSLAATIATNAYVPRSIVLYLALDELEVAAPILLLSPVLKEADIIALARKLVPASLQVLCRRADLTPSAVVSLLANGGKEAAELLARNAFTQKDAPVKRAETAKAASPAPVEKAASAAKAEPATLEKQAPLKQAEPVKSASAGAVSNPPAAQAERTEVRPATSPDTQEKASAEEQLLALAARGGRLGTNRAKASPSPTKPTESDAPFGMERTRELIQTARTGDRNALSEQIARHTGYAQQAVLRLVSGDSLQTLCVLLKGLGIDEVQATQLVLLLRPAIGRNLEELSGAVRLYKRLDARTCRQFLATFGNETQQGESGSGEMAASASATNLAEAIAERRREIATSGPMRPSARLAAASARPAVTDRLKSSQKAG